MNKAELVETVITFNEVSLGEPFYVDEKWWVKENLTHAIELTSMKSAINALDSEFLGGAVPLNTSRSFELSQEVVVARIPS